MENIIELPVRTELGPGGRMERPIFHLCEQLMQSGAQTVIKVGLAKLFVSAPWILSPEF